MWNLRSGHLSHFTQNAIASSLQVIGSVCILGWLAYAAVNLVRGR